MRTTSSARALLGATLALLAAACGSTKPDGFAPEEERAAAPDGGAAASEGPGGGVGPVFNAADASTSSTNACSEVIDVVFVLDVSSSMNFVLDKLTSEIDKVVQAANALAPASHFGLVAFVDNEAIDVTGPLEGGKVHTSGATLKTAFQQYKTTYTNSNRNPGDGPSGPTTQNPICEENSLDALARAAKDFPFRPNATRVVILATDDTFLVKGDNYGDRDGDGKTDKTSYPREGNYPARTDVAETVGALRAAKVRVFSFTRLKPPGFLDVGRCGTGRRHKTDDAVTFGWSKPYGADAPIPEATDGKNFDLDAVRTGSTSLSETIQSVVLDSYCDPPK